MITYSNASSNDMQHISQLLQKSGLPYIDIEESKVEFILARENNQVIGCIGMERYQIHGLLRSFAVETSSQNLGVGAELYNRMVLYCSQHGINTIHLLTNTAREYFLKKNFAVHSRDNVPESINNTKEFKSLCPSTSTYMIKQL